MGDIFLGVYFGEKLAEGIPNYSLFEIFSQTSILYILAFIIFVYFIFIGFFFIYPSFHKNPKTYFKRYNEIRENLMAIDDLYSKKKLSFEEYSFAQFNYAKEYEHIIVFLSKFPEYKSQLQSYKIKESENREKEISNLNKAEQQKIYSANFLCDLLKPHKRYYTRKEIEQSIIDEGFTKEIAKLVLIKLDDHGTDYGEETKLEQSKIVNIINALLAKNSETAKSAPQQSSFDIKDLERKKASKISEEKVTFEKYPTISKEQEKQGHLASIKSLFKSKPKPHTVSEINDIFAEIEKRLKENK